MLVDAEAAVLGDRTPARSRSSSRCRISASISRTPRGGPRCTGPRTTCVAGSSLVHPPPLSPFLALSPSSLLAHLHLTLLSLSSSPAGQRGGGKADLRGGSAATQGRDGTLRRTAPTRNSSAIAGLDQGRQAQDSA
jgi:hypothetical protein